MERAITCLSVALVIACWTVLPPTDLVAAEGTLKLLVRSEASAGSDVPVHVGITLPKDLADAAADQLRVELRPDGTGGPGLPGQIVKSDGGAELWWILPAAEAGAEQTWTATLRRGRPDLKETFAYQDSTGEHLELLFAGRPVTRYMYAHDTSTPERRSATWKTYHHVFDAEGKNVITQGAGGKLYPHHRGIFIGGKLRCGKDISGDWWHGQLQLHQEFLDISAGPVVARSTALIHWKTSQGKLALVEQRETTAYRQPSPTMLLLDFRSRLTGPNGDVSFGGDREHAGIQFRAHGDVDTSATRYQFPEEGTDVRKELDLPWAAMSFVLKTAPQNRYSVQHINHPGNPKGTEYSAYRDYGRFGAFFKKEIKSGETLEVRYRIWVAPGEMPPREQMQQRWEALAHPPKVEVVK